MTARVIYLTRRLKKHGERTAVFFQELTSSQWEAQVYSEGASWKVRQILAHFVAAEDAILRLIVSIVDGGDGVPEDFDLDVYNERKVDQLRDEAPDILLRKFDQARQKTIQTVAQFADADLDREGRHPWFGIAPIEDLVKLMYRHNQIHQRDIRKSLKLLT